MSFENLNTDTFREMAANMGNKKFKIKIGKIKPEDVDVMQGDETQVPKDFKWDDSKEISFRKHKKSAAYLLTSESWL